MASILLWQHEFERFETHRTNFESQKMDLSFFDMVNNQKTSKETQLEARLPTLGQI
jgi:hypothetical protein